MEEERATNGVCVIAAVIRATASARGSGMLARVSRSNPEWISDRAGCGQNLLVRMWLGSNGRKPTEVSSNHKITWSGSANGSASFNSQAATIGIRGTAGAVGTPGAVGILDRVRRERRAVAAVGVTGRIRIIRVRAELAPVLTLLIIEPWGVRRIGIRRRLIAEGTAVGAEGIVDAVRLEGASGSVGIGRGIRIVRIRAQLAEIFRVDGERQWQQQEQKEEDNPHGEPPKSGTTSGLSLLPAWRSAQVARGRHKKCRMFPFQVLIREVNYFVSRTRMRRRTGPLGLF